MAVTRTRKATAVTSTPAAQKPKAPSSSATRLPSQTARRTLARGAATGSTKLVLNGAHAPHPTLNQIPAHTSHPRPPRRLFVFGSRDAGMLGLGTALQKPIYRPRLHVWFEEAIAKGILGGDGAGVEAVAAGGMHTLVLDEAGRVWSFGVNDHGTLGRQTVKVSDPDNPGLFMDNNALESQPMLVQKLVDDGFRAVQIAGGDSFSVALGENGDLRVWGAFRSSSGLLGLDDASSLKKQLQPVELPTLRKIKFASVACGTDHVIALTTTGRVWVWGDGEKGRLGRRILDRRRLNALVPERLALKDIVLIGAGDHHSFAQDSKGVVDAWGDNSCHQTGVDAEMLWTPTEVTALHPDTLGNGRRVVQFSGGEHHSVFLLSDGTVLSCGRADDGQTGLAGAGKDDVRVPTPVQFPPPPDADDPNTSLENPIAYVSSGTRNNLAVSRAGHLYSWGLGLQGQLGLGPDTDEQRTPTRVVNTALSAGWTIESASAGGNHCVILAVKPPSGL